MQWSLVFLNLGEAANGFVETVVGSIVVALTHLANHNLSMPRLAIETVIEILLHANALTWMKHDTSTWLHDMLYAVNAEMNRSLGKLLILVGIVKLDDEVAATAIDDILHLGPVEVHGRFLVLLDDHDLLGIRFLIDAVLAISDGEQEETTVQEIARAEVGDVPTQHTLGDVTYTIFIGLPVGQTPVSPFGQYELTGCQKCLCIADDLIDFASFHFCGNLWELWEFMGIMGVMGGFLILLRRMGSRRVRRPIPYWDEAP